MTDIFISYAKEDRERARTLATALQAAGWSVWWDRNIQVGQAFDQVIEHALDSAKCVVVLWSKRSISSEWVKNEAASAAERGMLVPALIDDVKTPLEFRRKQTANLIDWEQDPSGPGFQALCDGIAAAAGLPQAPQPLDSGQRQQAGFRRDRRWVVAGSAVLAGILAGGTYFAVRALRPPGAERSTADSPSASLEAGVFDFTWPGGDCWEIDRGEAKAAQSCGSAKQTLQAGTYTVKPIGSGVFLPFQVAVKPNAVTIADAMGGMLDFRWPGGDCWEIDRGEAKAAQSCGSGKQALQAGTYTVKPMGSGVFLPFQVAV
ncbi:MAG: toll/interleukin-1 receptor domain-containing protein, partial [Bryobacteraceae bacterium]